jgi:hypothetical protein
MDTITDTLIKTLADVHARADVSLDLDSALNVLELASAELRLASPEEKRQLEERAKALAKPTADTEFVAFLTAFVEGLYDEPPETKQPAST